MKRPLNHPSPRRIAGSPPRRPAWERYGRLCLLIGLLHLPACAPPISEGGFDAPDPGSKLYAIHRAGVQRDVTAIPRLIEQLESDDPAVRQFADQALRIITGKEMGFRHFDPPHLRQPAVGRWQEAYQSGKLLPVSKPTSAEPSS